MLNRNLQAKAFKSFVFSADAIALWITNAFNPYGVFGRGGQSSHHIGSKIETVGDPRNAPLVRAECHRAAARSACKRSEIVRNLRSSVQLHGMLTLGTVTSTVHLHRTESLISRDSGFVHLNTDPSSYVHN